MDNFLNILDKIIKDLNYKKEANKNLELLQQYQQITNATEVVSKMDKNGIITFVNDKFCEMYGYSKDEIIGKNHNIIYHPDNPKEILDNFWYFSEKKGKWYNAIIRNKTKDGRSYYIDIYMMPIYDSHDNLLEYISIQKDITDILNPKKQLDDVIKNTNEFILVYLKLDKFKILEEFYKNEIIEEYQNQVAKKLFDIFHKNYDSENVYKLGNGEFALIISKTYLQDDKQLIKEISRLQRRINQDQVSVNGIIIDISVIISIAYEKEEILKSVKLGIKKLLQNKANIILANKLATKTHEKADKNFKTLTMIKDAIKDSKIVSYFQPIIDNKTKQIVKFESLVRLIDKNGNILTPYSFLNIAKKSGYYMQITHTVLKKSLKVLEISNKDISINLSVLDIERKATREKIFKLLEKKKNFANQIIFELLEDENVSDFDVIKEFVSTVKGYGARIAIDDFGSGYSNYERLLDYQPDILKIDGSLVKNILTSEFSTSIIKSIVTFAKEQNIQTVAEYIENKDIFNKIKELGVDYSQGYYFGKPEPLIIDNSKEEDEWN